MRHALTLCSALVTVAASAVPVRGQQDWPRAAPPRALLRQLLRDLGPDEDFVSVDRDQLERSITVRRGDLNGDGVREWFVVGTQFCGTNCSWWLNRRLPGGGFVQVYEGSGVSVVPLRERAHGWPNLRDYTHMSCCEGSTDTSVFDGTRYRWRETRYVRRPVEEPGERTVYRVAITPPASSGRRRLALDPVRAGGGVTVAARHDLCGAYAVCAPPELRLVSSAFSSGRACVTLRVLRYDERTVTRRLCGTTFRQTLNGRTARALVVHPTRADWGSIWLSKEMALSGPGLPGEIDRDAARAVSLFAGRLAAYYRLQCPPGYRCTSAR